MRANYCFPQNYIYKKPFWIKLPETIKSIKTLFPTLPLNPHSKKYILCFSRELHVKRNFSFINSHLNIVLFIFPKQFKLKHFHDFPFHILYIYDVKHPMRYVKVFFIFHFKQKKRESVTSICKPGVFHIWKSNIYIQN